MKHLRHIATRCSIGFVIAAAASSVLLRAQTVPPPAASASATSLTSSSPSLTLPGSLTLTSVVSAPKGGGMPTGKVSFFYDGTNSLGSASLSILPKTQLFPAGLTRTLSYGTNPYAFGASGFTQTGPINIALSDLQVLSQEDGPVLAIFPTLGRGGFSASSVQTLQTLPAGYYIDAVTSGNFNNDANREFLIHLTPYLFSSETSSFNGQLVIVDSALNTVSTQTPLPNCLGTTEDGSCDEYDPDAENLAVGDFTGDGFDDVASLVTSAGAPLENVTDGVYRVEVPIIRIGINNTQSGFTFGANAVLPGFPDVLSNKLTDTYCPNAIAVGRFRKGGNLDVVSVGQQTAYTNIPSSGLYPGDCRYPVAMGHLVLLLGDGKGGLAAQPALSLGSNPAAVGVADFNLDGNDDVVVADATDNTVEILYGKGDGTFSTQAFTISAGNAPSTLQVADFNGDGYPDVVIGDSGNNNGSNGDGNTYVLMNDGTGKLLAPVLIYTGTGPAIAILAKDMNADGLPDVTVLQPPPSDSDQETLASVAIQLSTASAQAVLSTAAQTLPAGNHALTATFPGDANFISSTSPEVPVAVTQATPVLTWQPPAAIEYGTPLGAAQLNATASVAGSFTYQPGAGSVLLPGVSMITTAFTPADSFDYAPLTGSVPITVNPPLLTGISPTSANLGSPAFVLTVNGQGFTQGASVFWNGTALATTFVSRNQLTATVPGALLTATGKASVTVTDPGPVSVSGSESFAIVAPTAVASANGPAMSDPGSQPSIQLSLSPYPAPVTVTASLSFAPASPDQPNDPKVLFANGTRTDTFVVPANSSAAIPSIDLQAGSTAGTITITIQLSADGTDITPSALAPVIIDVPAVAPIIMSVMLQRNGTGMQIVVTGLSSPRDMSNAQFQFEPAPGASLKTKDLTVTLTSAFTTWYQNEDSTAFGTAFQYTQPFILDSDATDVKIVTVILTNSAGSSQPASAQ
ncbi:FG-GAP-like repeat-containing protein [Paracidobacterium acidisoli]|uniref:IPT/TIG domain-containing protein n=1 Tax=Paracidobacterium acidisoli TaxID=2303751 RepID=A0A372IPD4_9BACT|nr:FG-GAP-like repeat-containing protein [Paracidobacterium acidisoli]MBT9331041.1 VCBS repeat-containing protein [Paracidobacterium acidisoli]